MENCVQKDAASLHINESSAVTDKRKEQSFFAQQIYEPSGTQSVYLYHLS